MKLLKKYLLLSLVAPLLFSLLSFTIAVAEGKEIVTIRVYENPTAKDRIEIYANGQASKVMVEKGTIIIEAISKTLEKYYNEGYKIETSDTLIHYGGVYVTTYILTK